MQAQRDHANVLLEGYRRSISASIGILSVAVDCRCAPLDAGTDVRPIPCWHEIGWFKLLDL